MQRQATKRSRYFREGQLLACDETSGADSLQAPGGLYTPPNSNSSSPIINTMPDHIPDRYPRYHIPGEISGLGQTSNGKRLVNTWDGPKWVSIEALAKETQRFYHWIQANNINISKRGGNGVGLSPGAEQVYLSLQLQLARYRELLEGSEPIKGSNSAQQAPIGSEQGQNANSSQQTSGGASHYAHAGAVSQAMDDSSEAPQQMPIPAQMWSASEARRHPNARPVSPVPDVTVNSSNTPQQNPVPAQMFSTPGPFYYTTAMTATQAMENNRFRPVSLEWHKVVEHIITCVCTWERRNLQFLPEQVFHELVYYYRARALNFEELNNGESASSSFSLLEEIRESVKADIGYIFSMLNDHHGSQGFGHRGSFGARWVWKDALDWWISKDQELRPREVRDMERRQLNQLGIEEDAVGRFLDEPGVENRREMMRKMLLDKYGSMIQEAGGEPIDHATLQEGLDRLDNADNTIKMAMAFQAALPQWCLADGL